MIERDRGGGEGVFPSERKIKLEFSASYDTAGVLQDTGGALVAKLMTAYLFGWKDVEAKSDLERLRLVLDHLPDETVMRRLEEHR